MDSSEIPEEARPRPEETAFDLDRALASVVGLRAEIPDDAFTAEILGTERAGHGVLIDEAGLVLTIGYLITEAEHIWISADGGAVAGHPLGYDQVTGFGLVQTLGRLKAPALPLGSAGDIEVGDPVVMAGHGGRRHALQATLADKRTFAGYWEYVLDEALFTAPAHPSWGGAALIGPDGRLVGIGSLLLRGEREDEGRDGNMAVPIDLLAPILGDLRRLGRVDRPPRPWLGMYTTEHERALVIAGLAPGGPGEQARLEVGDVVLAVAGEPVGDLADLFRKVWSLGPAGVEVPLTLLRGGRPLVKTLRSIDRNSLLKRPMMH